jgi:F0F1-type ATP synthase alpha subunit
MPVEEQVVSIFLGTGGHLDSVPVEDVRRFETELLDHIRASEEQILTGIRESQKLPTRLPTLSSRSSTTSRRASPQRAADRWCPKSTPRRSTRTSWVRNRSR